MTLPRTFFRIAASFAFLALAGCGDSATSPLAPTAPSSVLSGSLQLVASSSQLQSTVSTATIGPAGGTLNIAGGHSLYFPAGALAEPTTITAVSEPGVVSVDFAPHGLVFPANARPTLTYSYVNSGFLTLIDPYSLSIVYVEDGQVVDVLPTTPDTAQGVVRAQLEHFSTYALATD